MYMALIAPFRYLIVYPAITRQWERAWRDRERPLPASVDTIRGLVTESPGRQHPTGTMPG
jgi:hypothetical protein